MEVRFYIDPQTGAPHIYNHNVRESEVEEVLANPGEDRPGRDGSRVAIGRTLGGRLTPRCSGHVIDKVPSSNVGARAAQLNR